MLYTILSKFLGLYIGCKLDEKAHIDYASSKMARGVDILVMARKNFDEECLKKFYCAFVYPYLNYCNHIWGNTYKTSLSNLNILQNRYIRMITGSPSRTSDDLLYKQYGMLNLKNINIFFSGEVYVRCLSWHGTSFIWGIAFTEILKQMLYHYNLSSKSGYRHCHEWPFYSLIAVIRGEFFSWMMILWLSTKPLPGLVKTVLSSHKLHGTTCYSLIKQHQFEILFRY